MLFKKLVTLFILVASTLTVFAQEASTVSMADEMRASGKIYVVVAVLVIIFFGIVIYLSRLDKKITKLEKELKK
jgi:CcmD family protein